MNQFLKIGLLGIFCWTTLCVPGQSQEFSYKNQEKFLYKISYGWINIGEAQLSNYQMDSVITVDVLAYTTGIINWIARLRDSVHTVINRETLKPITAYMDRKEGKYSRREADYFDFEKDTATIDIYRSRANEQVEIETRHIPLKDSTYDMLSSYVFLRSQSYDQLNPGDSLMLNMFYEGKYYPFGIEYIEKVNLTTALGDFSAHHAYILFPISRTFPEKHMVEVWVSADHKRLPLLIEAKMKFGRAVCKLIEVSH